MSEKIKNNWRRFKELVELVVAFIPIVLMAFVAFVILLFITAFIKGSIFCLCWNFAVTEMLGLKEISVMKAFVFAFAVGCLRSNYTYCTKKMYRDMRRKIFERNKSIKRKTRKNIAMILTLIFVILSLLIMTISVQYTWNNIIPELLDKKLIHINFRQAFAFSFLFNMLFGDRSYEDNKDNKKSNKKQVISTENKNAENKEIESQNTTKKENKET